MGFNSVFKGLTVRVELLRNGRLVNFQRRYIFGAPLAEASVNKMATLLGLCKAAVSKVTMACVIHGRTSSTKSNCGREPKLSETVRHTLKRIVSKIIEHQQKWQQNWILILENLVSPKTVRRQLHKSNIHGRAAIDKPLTTENDAKGRKGWWDDHKTWSPDDWKYVIWSDESSVTLFQASGRVYVWKTPKEAYNPECLVPTVKHGATSVMIWAAISCYRAGPFIVLNGRITANDYMHSVGSQLQHLMVQILFPNNDANFQGDSSPIHTARSVHS